MDRLHPQLLIRRTFVSLSPSLQIATFKLDPQIPRPAEAEESLRFKPQGNWIIQKMKIYFGINLFSGKILLWKRHNLAPGVMIPTLPCSTIFWKYKNIHLNIKNIHLTTKGLDMRRALSSLARALPTLLRLRLAPLYWQSSQFHIFLCWISSRIVLDFFIIYFGFSGSYQANYFLYSRNV